MRRIALAVLALAAAGCGAGEETGEGGACAAGIAWHDIFYYGASLPSPRPPVGEKLEDGIQPGCNDGGPHEEDRPTDVYRIQGVAPEIAVYGDDIVRDPYLNPGAFTELPEHPLHANYHSSPQRPIRRVRGEPCTVDGRVRSLSAVFIDTADGERNVIIDARTRITGFEQAGMPILHEGDAVRVRGPCHGEVIGARLIEPQP
jgi:hypothetical protein